MASQPATAARLCPQCKRAVVVRAPQARYCSDACRLAAQNERRRQTSYHHGPQYPCCCRWHECRADLPDDGRRDMLFCSTRCRVAYWRYWHRKHAEEKAAAEASADAAWAKTAAKTKGATEGASAGAGEGEGGQSDQPPPAAGPRLKKVEF